MVNDLKLELNCITVLLPSSLMDEQVVQAALSAQA